MVETPVKEVRKLTISELEQVIEICPWFALARKEYFLRMARMGAESISDAARKVGLYVFSRTHLYNALHFPTPEPVEEEQATAEQPERPKYYVVGGDWFGSSDFEELERSGESFKGFDTNPLKGILAREGSYMPELLQPAKEPFLEGDEEIYTETMAQIYEEQGYYQRAIDIYQKLILLYPEKNTYFAVLIEKVKSKNI